MKRVLDHRSHPIQTDQSALGLTQATRYKWSDSSHHSTKHNIKNVRNKYLDTSVIEHK